jgi:hypothetical protein
MLFTLSLTIHLFILASNAVPAPVKLAGRASITALTTAQISAYKPYTYFASTGYCVPAETLTWSCGSVSVSNDYPVLEID